MSSRADRSTRPTGPMTAPTRLVAALGLALGLAAAPAAQVLVAPDDADEPGRAIVTGPAAPGFVVADDQDPISLHPSRPFAARANAVGSEPAWTRDEDAPLRAAFVPEARTADVGPLADGRSGGAPAPPAVAEGGALDDGRPAVTVLRRDVTRVYTGALRDGRPDGARGTPVLADEAPVVAPFRRSEAEAARAARVVVQPNPASAEAWVELASDAPARATVAVFDVRGREVLKAYDGTVAPGASRVRLDLAPLSAGTYVVTVEVDGVRASETFQVVR